LGQIVLLVCILKAQAELRIGLLIVFRKFTHLASLSLIGEGEAC
jgi:hypothetical protein